MPHPAADLAPSRPRALVVDWGGVLTTGLDVCVPAWAERDGVDFAAFATVLDEWLGPAAAREAAVNPVHALERGEMRIPDFERLLAARLRTFDGRPVVADGLIDRMFAGFEHAPAMANVVRRARAGGVRTALLSNSWGNEYPRDGWDELFDAVVISGEVGMRKPEPRIFQHTLELLGCRPAEAVFVDDQPVNVRAAAAMGMVGVVHQDYERTVEELAALFGGWLAG